MSCVLFAFAPKIAYLLVELQTEQWRERNRHKRLKKEEYINGKLCRASCKQEMVVRVAQNWQWSRRGKTLTDKLRRKYFSSFFVVRFVRLKARLQRRPQPRRHKTQFEESNPIYYNWQTHTACLCIYIWAGNMWGFTYTRRNKNGKLCSCHKWQHTTICCCALFFYPVWWMCSLFVVEIVMR